LKGNFDLSIQCLKGAILKDPKYRLAMDNLAVAYNDRAVEIFQTDKAKATELFRRSLSLNPYSAVTRKNLELVNRLPDQPSSVSPVQPNLPAPDAVSSPMPAKVAQHAVASPDFAPWMTVMQHQIKMNWFPPRGNSSTCGVVNMNVYRDSYGWIEVRSSHRSTSMRHSSFESRSYCRPVCPTSQWRP